MQMDGHLQIVGLPCQIARGQQAVVAPHVQWLRHLGIVEQAFMMPNENDFQRKSPDVSY